MGHKRSLKKLANYLDSLPADYDRFDMKTFQSEGRTCSLSPVGAGSWSRGAAAKMKCGTVACAAGHGPSAGIKPRDGEDWDEYSNRLAGGCSLTWDWLFHDGWADVDNTVEGAVSRIRYYLEEEQIPDWFESIYDAEIYADCAYRNVKENY